MQKQTNNNKKQLTHLIQPHTHGDDDRLQKCIVRDEHVRDE